MQSEPRNEGIFSTLKELQNKTKEAEKIATEIGEMVGRVSPYSESITGAEGFKARILVEVDKYLQLKRFLAQPGAILAAVDIATLEVISLKVVGASRIDFYSIMGAQEAITPHPILHDPRGLLTKPQVLVEPLLAFRFQDGRLFEGRASSYVIEPRSPVVLPKPEFLETLSGIKGEVVLGALTIGEEPLMSENRIARALLPFDDLFYHTFVVGTTGSGKTTFVKNLIKSLLDLKKGVAIICIDENGDYVQTIFDPQWELEDPASETREKELAKQLYRDTEGLKEINILLPVTKQFAEDVESLEKLAKKYYENYLKKLHMQAELTKEVKYCCERENKIAVLSLVITNKQIEEKEIRKVRVIPYVLNFDKLKDKIADLYPYFTARARESFQNLLSIFTTEERIDNFTSFLSEHSQSKGRYKEKVSLEEHPSFKLAMNLEGLIDNLDELERVNASKIFASYARIHHETLENLIRGLHNLNQMGIFDVSIGGEAREEPEVEAFIRENSLTVLDLRPLSMREERLARGAKRILTLRLLNRILGWKMEKEFEYTPPTIVLVDEAHRFFPRTAGKEEEDYVEYVSGALERLARLGRVRRLGLILSTHSPKDVHSTVLNLCNNKVVFRLEHSQAEELGLPKELRDFISKASDRVGVATSHALRLHYATFKTPPPVLGHLKSRG
jgi:DNA helicase HerA-like ATPase